MWLVLCCPLLRLAAPFAKCTCRGLQCVSGNCTTAIYVGHRGTDSKGASMTSAYQIEQLNQYSFVNWFQSVSLGIASRPACGEACMQHCSTAGDGSEGAASRVLLAWVTFRVV